MTLTQQWAGRSAQIASIRATSPSGRSMPIKICIRRAGACLNTDCSASFMVGRMTVGMMTATSDGRCRSKSAAA
jgi:hypothetical protein